MCRGDHAEKAMSHVISLLTDEVSADIGTALAFAAAEGLGMVDVRSVGGVNFLSLEPAEQQRIAGAARDAGMAVGCLATPLLKWPAPGQRAASLGDQFGFDAGGRGDAQLFDDAIRAADLLGTRNLRVFTLLTYAGFGLDDLAPAFDALLRRAEQHDCTIHVENEPVCNVATIAGLAALMARYRHPRLRAILDAANHTADAGAPPAIADCIALMPFVDIVHMKDYALGPRRSVPIGDGDVPYRDLLPACLAAAAPRQLTLTIETHVPGDGPGATRRNIAAVRHLLR